MAFGLTQWLISFVIFLAVLTIISWSAIRLGTKDKNVTAIVSRFLHMDDYSIERKNLTTRVTESTDSTMLYADNQGFEITDSAEFYKILKAMRSTKNSTVNNTKNNTTTALFTLSINSNSTWSQDTTIYNSSDTLNNYQNISREIINISNHTPLMQPMVTHEAKLLDMNRLWETDPYYTQSTEKEFSDHLDSKENGTITFSFVQMSSGVIQSNTTQQTRIMQSIHTKQNE